MTETDVSEIKRADRAIRRDVLRLLRPRWRRCARTFPFFHKYPSWITTSSTSAAKVSTCEYCGRPYSLECFDLYDLLQLAERQEVPEEALEPLWARWRARPR